MVLDSTAQHNNQQLSMRSFTGLTTTEAVHEGGALQLRSQNALLCWGVVGEEY